MSRILAIALLTLTRVSMANEYLVRVNHPEVLSSFVQKVGLLGGKVTRIYDLVPGLMKVEATEDAAANLLNLNSVLYVEPNHIRRPEIISKINANILADPALPAPTPRPTEWKKNGSDTKNFGLYQNSTKDVFEKRKFYGSEKIVIAVLDTGIDYTHPDLAANVWRNPGESGNGRETNGVDDDGNGYVDDVVGYDFVNRDNLPYDDNGHGTHVSGIAAAVGGNGFGISGHCARCSVMGIKFITSEGYGTDADAIEGLEYAAKMGAHIINSSWGGDVYSQALDDAFKETSKLGVFNIVAAGNSGVNLGFGTPPAYPAMFVIPGLMSVAALYEVQNFIPFWSNHGSRYVKLSMAGHQVYSLIPGNKYSAYSGTSMASPGLAGILGLMLSYRPNLTLDQVDWLFKKSTIPDERDGWKTENHGRPNTYRIFELMDALP